MMARESYSPAVAFGLYAATVALKAKAGVVARGTGRDLLRRHAELVPDDWPSALASADFVAALSCDAAQAADGFLDFLTRWPPEAPTEARRVEAGLATAAREFEDGGWGARADCGHG